MVTPGKLSSRAVLFEQLGTMIGAGMPLAKALEMVARNRRSGFPPKVIQEIILQLQEGHTFSDAIQLAGQRHSGGITLSEFDIAMLSAGEESGRLDQAFKLLARDYASRAAIFRDVLSQSAVTTLTLHVFLIVFPLGYLVSFVLGIMNNQWGNCVPFVIEKIIAFGLLYGVLFSLLFAGQGTHGERWRAFTGALFNITPLLRTAIKDLAVARLAMALNALMSAGVPVIKAWEMAARVCGAPVLKREILRRTESLDTGTTPAEMVSQIKFFPDMFTQSFQSGEISGRLDETLTYLHTYYQDEGYRKLRAFCRLVSILLYLIIVFMVAKFVIGFYVGYFNQALNAF